MNTLLWAILIVASLILIGAIGSIIEGDNESLLQEKSYYPPPSYDSPLYDEYLEWKMRQEMMDREYPERGP